MFIGLKKLARLIGKPTSPGSLANLARQIRQMGGEIYWQADRSTGRRSAVLFGVNPFVNHLIDIIEDMDWSISDLKAEIKELNEKGD